MAMVLSIIHCIFTEVIQLKTTDLDDQHRGHTSYGVTVVARPPFDLYKKNFLTKKLVTLGLQTNLK